MKRTSRLIRLRMTRVESLVADSAMSLLEERLRADPSFGSEKGFGHRDVRLFRGHLEGTFLIRLFAEFEAGLRDAWSNSFGQATHPGMRDLVDAVSARRRVDDLLTGRVHAVREYRNGLIHEGREPAEPIPLGEALSTLERFLARLPPDW